jgi:hypothetical protein
MAKKAFLQNLFGDLVRDSVVADDEIREGRFQKFMALMAGFSSLLSGLDVTLEHYRGSYGQRVMYSPVLISPILLVAGIWGFFSKRAARTFLPIVSALTMLDCLVGFGFHVRGIARKPGGWRLPVANIIMGPPIFAPLLFGISGYLGIIAAFLRRSEGPAEPKVHPAKRPIRAWLEMGASDSQTSDSQGDQSKQPQRKNSWEQDIREGRFQKHLAVATAASSLFSGVEALYSHYKNNFQYKVQWSPIIISPLLSITAIVGMFHRKTAKTLLPALSLLAIADGTGGFYFHARGILRRPGGIKKLFYNVIYGPPIFAPLLFAACGFLGLLASLMRREK